MKNAHGIEMPVEFYRIYRKSTESYEDFQTRIANEIRTMDVRIISSEMVSATEYIVRYSERAGNY